MAKLVKIDPVARFALPSEADGAKVELRWSAGWRIGALLAGGSDRGTLKRVDGEGQNAAFKDAAGTGDLLVAVPEVGDVLPGEGLPTLTLIIRPTYPPEAKDPKVPIQFTARPHETSDGVWNLRDIGDDASGPVLVTVAERLAVSDATSAAVSATADLNTKKAQIDQSLAISAQLHDTLAPLVPAASAAAAAKADALAAAAAKADALAAAALLPSLAVASGIAATDHAAALAAIESAAASASADRAAMQAALDVLGAIPTAIKGLRVNAPVAGETGGLLYEFVVDPTATTNATVKAGETGGLLYDFTGGS